MTHPSLHEYDVNALNSEISNLKAAIELLKNTEVPDFVYMILKDQISSVEFILKYGHDPRLV